MEKIKLKNPLIIFLSFLLIFVYIVFISPINIQNDIFFDIKLGEKYLTNGINTIDEFSIHENLNYISHHFIVNIITYLVYNFIGIKGIYFLEIFLALLLAYLFYKANKIYIKNDIVAYFLVFIELFFMISFISQRAQMYSYLLFLIEIICIEKFLRTRYKRYLITLSLIPLFIINFHAGVLPFYFIIIFVYFFNYIKINFIKIINEESFVKNLKYLFIPIIAGIILMFCNLFGIDGVLYSFKTLSNEFISNNIVEFQPSNIINNTLFYLYILCFVVAYIMTNKKIKIHQILLLLGTCFMTLLSLRHFSLLIIVSITSMDIVEELILRFYSNLKKGIQEDKEKSFKNAMLIASAVIILLISFNNFVYMDKRLLSEDFYSVGGVEYIKNNISKEKNIFNEYSWGTLMMLNDIKVFIDSRCDLYTEEYNKDTTVAVDYIDAVECKKDYGPIFEKYDIDYVFIKKEAYLNEFLKNDNKYKLIYSDDISVIYELSK